MVSTQQASSGTSRSATSVIEMCDAGRYRDAQAALDELETGDPLSGLARGIVEIYRGNLDAAKDHLTPLAFSSDPLAGRAKVHLAHAYHRAGEIREAMDLLRDAPVGFHQLLMRAVLGDPDQKFRPQFVLRLLDKCSTYDVRPGLRGRVHYQRALTYRKSKKLNQAIQEYQAALEFFEKDHSDSRSWVLNNLARVYLECGETGRAHELVDKAIALLHDDLPHLGKAFDEKSRIFTAQGDLKAARVNSERAIAVLRQSDRKEWLIEALLTYSEVLRTGGDEKEFAVLQEAADACRFLQRSDLLIEVLKRRHELSQIVSGAVERELIETAWRVCNGSYRGAAAKSGTTHPRLKRLVKKYGLDKKLQQSDS